MKFLMCRPTHYGVYYEINPWMHIKNPVTASIAQDQWNALCETILRAGATIELIDPVPNLPDMVFTANAGIIYKNQVLVADFKSVERQPESLYFRNWFTRYGLEVVNEPLNVKKIFTLEGAGDALFLGKTLMAGYGFRSQKEACHQSFFQQFDVLPCELVDPYFYHLDTCFCPLNSNLAIWYPPAFGAQTQRELGKACELLEVTREEAHHFACNAIVVNNQVILPKGCPILSRQLEKLGFIVFPCEMSEFIKAGGACKCLTLQL